MSRFVVEHAIQGTLVLDVASRIAKAIVFELAIHATANIIELFVLALVLQTASFYDSGLMTWLYDPLRPCGENVYLIGC